MDVKRLQSIAVIVIELHSSAKLQSYQPAVVDFNSQSVIMASITARTCRSLLTSTGQLMKLAIPPAASPVTALSTIVAGAPGVTSFALMMSYRPSLAVVYTACLVIAADRPAYSPLHAETQRTNMFDAAIVRNEALTQGKMLGKGS
jgi:hypothetical protein